MSTETHNIYGNNIDCTRLDHTINGNPRFAVHFLSLGLSDHITTKHTKHLFSKLRNQKAFAGGLVTESHNREDTLKKYFQSVAKSDIFDMLYEVDFEEHGLGTSFKNLLTLFNSEYGHELTRNGYHKATTKYQKENIHRKMFINWLIGMGSGCGFSTNSEEQFTYFQKWGLVSSYTTFDDLKEWDQDTFYALVYDVVMDNQH